MSASTEGDGTALNNNTLPRLQVAHIFLCAFLSEINTRVLFQILFDLNFSDL